MIWMSWRQFRAQAVVGATALLVTAVYLVLLGTQIRHTYHADIAQCRTHGDCATLLTQFLDEYRTRLYLLDALIMAVPGLLGLFWGAPLVARELETGTHRLVWNQSVTRRRWLLVKLLVVGLASMAMAGLLSALMTWAASRYDLVAAGPLDPLGAGRFSTLLFGARNITPVAYAAFAFALGAVMGMVIRRTVPAMALTLLVFIAVQVMIPNLIRPHLMPPVTVSKPMTADAINHLSMLGGLGRGAVFSGLKIPDAWVTHTSELLTADGRPLDPDRFNNCISAPPSRPQGEATGTFGNAAQCLGDLNLHVRVSYQPVSRYWSFQWRESAIFFLLSVLLAGFGTWWIERRFR